jgi:hypothetical protein
MNTSALKEEIHNLIEEVDEKVLSAVHSLLTKITQNNSYDLTDKEIAQLDKEYKDYKKGLTKGYTLNEAKKLISFKK